jgi:F-type H+-transporting ATPase subunit delta
VKSSIIGRRYGTALFELAEAQKLTSRVEKELADFAATWVESRDLREAFENPKVPQAARRELLVKVLDRMGASPLLKNTLCLLADRRRMRHLPEVAAAFEQLVEARTGRVRAEVTSASALPDAYYEQLQKALGEVTGKQVILVKKQDPTLIAGIVTRVGDKVFDGSLRNRLNELKEELLAS